MYTEVIVHLNVEVRSAVCVLAHGCCVMDLVTAFCLSAAELHPYVLSAVSAAGRRVATNSRAVPNCVNRRIFDIVVVSS